MAATLLVFDVYWLWKSWTIGYHVLKGSRIMRRFQKRDWRHEYEQTVMRGLPFNNAVAWDDVRHVVIIPNYKESESKLRQTLTAMAATHGARENVIPVLAMEEAEPGARAQGRRPSSPSSPVSSTTCSSPTTPTACPAKCAASRRTRPGPPEAPSRSCANAAASTSTT